MPQEPNQTIEEPSNSTTVTPQSPRKWYVIVPGQEKMPRNFVELLAKGVLSTSSHLYHVWRFKAVHEP